MNYYISDWPEECLFIRLCIHHMHQNRIQWRSKQRFSLHWRRFRPNESRLKTRMKAKRKLAIVQIDWAYDGNDGKRRKLWQRIFYSQTKFPSSRIKCRKQHLDKTETKIFYICVRCDEKNKNKKEVRWEDEEAPHTTHTQEEAKYVWNEDDCDDEGENVRTLKWKKKKWNDEKVLVAKRATFFFEFIFSICYFHFFSLAFSSPSSSPSSFSFSFALFQKLQHIIH